MEFGIKDQELKFKVAGDQELDKKTCDSDGAFQITDFLPRGFRPVNHTKKMIKAIQLTFNVHYRAVMYLARRLEQLETRIAKLEEDQE